MNLHSNFRVTVSRIVLLIVFNFCVGDVAADALDRSSWSLSSSHNSASLSNAIDSTMTTRWDSGTNQAPGQYIQIDLGSEKTIDGIELSNEGSNNDFPRGYEVFLSNNASSFGDAVASGAGIGTETVISFAPTNARYVRVTQTGATSFYWWSVHDLNIFESDSPVDNKLDRSQWTLSASTNSADLAFAIDGDDTSRWTSLRQIQTPGQYVQIDLGNVYSINNIVLDSSGSANDHPNGYAVYVSTDLFDLGSPVASGSGSSDGITDIEFSTVPGRYVRIEQTGSTEQNWWSIHEMNIYSSRDVEPPVGDECDTTAQCKAIYGPIADDCADSQSDTSLCFCGAEACYLGGGIDGDGECEILGDLEQWHRVELLCEGPSMSESNDSTFTDYRFNVTFSNRGESFTVPGHFAADGNAADTNSVSGNKWRAYFSPPTTGVWTYNISFRSGSNIALSTSSGSSVSGIDNTTGSFTIDESTATGTDMRKRGLLKHNDNERYLRFADGSIFIEGGMGSPENIFGYSEFDNTSKQSNVSSCKGILHDFDDHESDWNNGDPTWDGGKGKSLIGLVNYIASHGVNSAYIMMNTVSGDGCDAHPWSSYNSSGTVKSFDVSKLDQWERVLGHMTENGIMIHAMLQETENENLLNNGELGNERKLYYRELISRFGHHPALQWNIGEENRNTDVQRKAYTDYIKQVDPYDHMIKMHTYPHEIDEYYGLLGHDTFDGATIQRSGISSDADTDGDGVYGMATEWLNRSADEGQQWVVTFTEASGNDAPTPYDEVTSLQRVYWMWASAMSGGGGFAWYLKSGSNAGHAYDLAVEDMREFDEYWEQSGYFVSFFRDTVQSVYGIDLQDFEQDNGATSTSSDWVLSDGGSAYIVYLREGGSTNINVPNGSTYRVLWFNPRTGQYTQGATFTGPGNESIGNPPSETSSDWVVLVAPEPENSGAGTDYVERNGLVVIQAENTKSDLGDWDLKTDVSGYTGSSYIEFSGNTPINGDPGSPLEYSFSVSKSGLYHLHMYVAREELFIDGEWRSDVANDGYVRLDGNYGAGQNVGNSHGDDAPLESLQEDTKFFGGDDNQFAWAYGNRLDLGGENNKRIAVYALQAGESYTFVMHGRSQLFKVDRIVFRHEDVAVNTAQSLSLSETI
ncbi:MAG: discoidin domain-containing protein [Acidiferrobacterales bacterium]|nr:discoidin domain-containing protein [Acidiferrobacterales bacterium]